MAPSPEDDNTPKAPDKCDKNKYDKLTSCEEKDKDEKSLSNLNDGELKALLDEAINYKNPKDREGKSKLFKDLLHQAEETERIARATSAGGSELVRHCNPSARRNAAAAAAQRHHDGGGAGAGRRKSSRRTASESVRHGGSLDNLAKEELFLETKHTLMVMQNKQTARRTSTAVSARQREGGSLPCGVNNSVVPSRSEHFLEEARKNKAMKDDKDYTAIDIEALETQRLLDHDSLAQNYEEERHEVTFVPKFTSVANLQISGTPVDDPIPFQDLDSIAENKKCYDVETLSSRIHSKYSVYIPTYRTSPEEKKVDENGNALHQNTKKKKKVQTDKNVVVRTAESVEGHRSDIIHDVDKLMQYIGGDKDTLPPSKNKSNINKSKQLKQHSEDGGTQKKKQRAHSTKTKDSRSELKKSNSLGEISTAKLDNFAFIEKEEKVVLRSSKGSQNERPKERRSWGNMEPSFQVLSSNTSMENLDATGNWVVTKPKKKSKKRRNSISSGRRQNSPLESNKQPTNRAPSPDLLAKSARSVPHSERSNDSSDADSVHSLPIDGLNVPISYADIAKNSEKFKDKKMSPEKPEKTPSKESSPKSDVEVANKYGTMQIAKKLVGEKSPNSTTNITPPSITKNSPPAPDFNNIKNFPAIPQDTNILKSPIPVNEEIVIENTIIINKVNVSLESQQNTSLDLPVAETNPKSYPSPETHKVVIQDNTKTNNSTPAPPQPPPDVHNIKSFPAMPNPNAKAALSVEKPVVKTVNADKPLNVPPPVTKAIPKSNVTNNLLKSNPARGAKVHNDIQNDLTILHSNEKESIQFNAQMLPPDIPDVRTIEKMHFMNLSTPPPPSTQTNQQYLYTSSKNPQQQQQHHHHHNTPMSPPSQVPPNKELSTCSNKQAANIVLNNIVNCDSSERTLNENRESPPPVVILSGVGNKEVSGLVFGFDVNEQLLNEDICENFISRYVAPENFKNSTHNHDKIVNFIGSAWEAIVNQSNGKVQYYREES